MVAYRRNFVPGGTYFFTVTLADRRSSLLIDRIDDLREAFRFTRARWPFEMVAVVVLPEHLHCIWTLPPDDSDYPQRWRSIKSRFSRACASAGVVGAPNAAGERGIWQRRYIEHTIRDDRDLAHHIDYIHYNPVKHHHAKRPRDWPYSSFHRYVREGTLALDWAAPPAFAMDEDA
jgi:putative transposase